MAAPSDTNSGVGAVALRRLRSELYNVEQTVENLFGDLEGSVLVAEMFKTYGHGRDPSSEFIDMEWFNDSGDRNIVKHQLNRPVSEAVADVYKNKILEVGSNIQNKLKNVCFSK